MSQSHTGQQPIAVIIGGGPAGLTAAYELITRTDVQPIVLEASEHLGGIARTENFKGNRIDIGGHRFFSKVDRVMRWWLDRMPLQKTDDDSFRIMYQGASRDVQAAASGADPDTEDRVMLVRSRKSRIYWRRKLFDYPLSLSADTIGKLGLPRMAKIGCSYMRSMALPIRPERTLEEFFINRFGRELYRTFFKSYTEKVWGVPCHEIPADWGAQRIKGLSIKRALQHMLKGKPKGGDIAQKGVETSLIERFLYPKLGPGQMWQITAEEIRSRGGQVLMQHVVTGLRTEGRRVVAVKVLDRATGKNSEIACDYAFSSMPINELFRCFDCEVPADCMAVAQGLMYRDFFTVGLLCDRMKLAAADGSRITDNWIYIQEPDVLIGRLQIFNNWSPYLVADPSKTWLGLEYFCRETDEIWSRADERLVELGIEELHRIDMIDRSAAIDGCVIRVKKTYPAYFGAYERFDVVRDFLCGFENLFCVGRNGQHRYNNQDHSMLSAMIAVDQIAAGRIDMPAIWNVNVEQEYHESKSES